MRYTIHDVVGVVAHLDPKMVTYSSLYDFQKKLAWKFEGTGKDPHVSEFAKLLQILFG